MHCKQVVIVSDVSFRFGVMGYAIAMRVDGGPVAYISGSHPTLKNSTPAELATTALAMRKAPAAEVALVYTDVITLPPRMNYELNCLGSRPTEHYVREIRQAEDRFGVVCYRMVDRSVRRMYSGCHQRARGAARLTARENWREILQ